MKATEMIKKLQELVEKHGDSDVYSGGEDYPGRVRYVDIVSKLESDGYRPEGTFRIIGGVY